jgi:hypothetical protein
VFFLIITLLDIASAIPCYFPDGRTLAQNDSSCSGSASGESPSSCCPVGYACLSNSVCQDPTVLGGFFRSSCTDQSWESSACPKYCIISTNRHTPYVNKLTNELQIRRTVPFNCSGVQMAQLMSIVVVGAASSISYSMQWESC